jgi:hypothetical protein
MKAAERVLNAGGTAEFSAIPANLVATNIRLPRGVDHLKAFLEKYPDDRDLSPALEIVFNGLQHADELGSLLQIEGPVEAELKKLEDLHNQAHATVGVQTHLYKPTPIQGQLPVGVASYEAWKVAVLERLSIHFAGESSTSDLSQAFWGRAAKKALQLFQLLSQRYDVVATNPPFMGSKSMPSRIKTFVATAYPHGKRDFLAAFIVRARELVYQNNGFIGIVSQHTVLFLKSYSALRGDDSTATPGLLRSSSIVSIVQLGSGAFSEISGVVVSPILLVLQASDPESSHRLVGIRTTDHSDVLQKASALQDRCSNSAGVQRFTPLQVSFLALSRTPIPFWLPEKLLSLFQRGETVSDRALVRQGICTTNNNRFLRFYWEVAASSARWIRASKGGGFGRWLGFDQIVIDWELNGARVKSFQEDTPGAIHWSGRMPSDDYFFRGGWTYSAVSTAVGARLIDRHTLFLDTAPIAIARDASDSDLLGGVLNSRVASYLVRSLTQDAKIREGYLQRIPWPSKLCQQASKRLVGLVNACLETKRAIVADDPTAWAYEPSSDFDQNRRHLLSTLLSCLEYEIDMLVADAYGLDSTDLENIFAFTGSPAASLPLVVTYDNYQQLLAEFPDVAHFLESSFRNHATTEKSMGELENLRTKIKSLYELESLTGTRGDPSESESESEDEDESDEGSELAFKVPLDSKIERISEELSIHPISTILLLQEGVKREGWRSKAESLGAADSFLEEVLSTLGHRRHGETGLLVEADKIVQNGLLPLSDNGEAASLIRAGILARYGLEMASRLEQELSADSGTQLREWLTAKAFEYSVGRFNRRPIVWQIQSQAATRRKAAFVILIHYLQLGRQTLAVIQSQYARPQRQRYETELRGIESIPQKARSDRQHERRNELMDLITELRNFDEQLENVSRCGFGPDKLLPRLRQYAIDDAMLCLKTAWLKRLGDVVAAGPLTDWQDKATKTKLHADLSSWIDNAMSKLWHHCSSAGPTAPKQELLHDDATSASLASVICKNPDEMVAAVITLACDFWRKQLSEAVFAPLRLLIKEAKDELKQLKEEDYGKVGDPFKRRKEIDARTKELKESVKGWDRDLKDKTETAEKLRNDILSWRCPEARTWENWLASQPMYDAISGLDGVRRPPRSVAEWVAQESAYAPDINDGVRVNIAPLQKAGLLAADVLAAKDLDKAIADRADWRTDERRWCREGKLPQPGWWLMEKTNASAQD